MRVFSHLFFMLFAFAPKPFSAQVFDDFHDQSLFQGLIWGGDLYEVHTNSGRQLQLAADSSGSTTIYFTPNALDTNFECRFWLRENFSPSGLNFGRFYLRADQSDLLAANNALYLEFGEAGSQDAPKLFLRQNGVDTLLALGPAGSIASAFQMFFEFKLSNGVYELFARNSMAAANNLWLTGLMPWLPAGPYAGLVFIYTSSNKQNFYLDDLYYGPILATETPQIIFTEIMADPEPQQGLPNTEYLEIYNAGALSQQLSGWQIADANGLCTLPSFWLHPGAYATLVATTNSSGFNPNRTIEIPAFPSLNNTGELLHLFEPQGNLVDQLNYDLSWHQDSLAKEGGYSLERRSLLDPCSAADNWGTSAAALGGTPGLPNAIIDLLADTLAPQLLYAEVRDSNQIAFVFSEPLDSLILTQLVVDLDTNLGLFTKIVLPFSATDAQAQLLLLFDNPLPKSQVLWINLSNFSDCWGNTAQAQTTVIRYEEPLAGDVVINEILFDPPTGGSDFIELYNRTEKYLQLKNYILSNGLTTSELKPIVLTPHQYIALSPDTAFLATNYPSTLIAQTAVQILPYFYNDSGTCILSCNNEVLDELHYAASWHTLLLADTEGVSLERLDPDLPTQSALNWFSAAQIAGFASPGRSNTQQLSDNVKGKLTLGSPDFSPDLDGYHDFLEIHYELPAPNMLVQANIYTLDGILVKRLVIDELFGTAGLLIWDGSSEFGTIAPIGIYILDFKAFSTEPGVFFHRKLSFSRCYKR